LLIFKDLSPDLRDPITANNTFKITNFTRAEAEEVIKECATVDNISMPPEMPKAIVNDLAEQDEVRPVELQIVCTALRGNFGIQHYRTAGGASAILSRHVKLAIETAPNPPLARLVLRSLCDFTGNAKAPPAPIPEITHRLGPQKELPAAPEMAIQGVLEQLEMERLAVHQRTGGGIDQWTLIHDYLVGPVKLATQDASTKVEDATRVFNGYLVEAKSESNRAVTIPLGKLREIRKFLPPEVLNGRDARQLLRRSYIVAYGWPSFLVFLTAVLVGVVAAFLGTDSGWYPAVTFRHFEGPEDSDVIISAHSRTADNDIIVTSNSNFDEDDKIVVLWEAATGQELRRYRGNNVFVADSKVVVENDNNKNL